MTGYDPEHNRTLWLGSPGPAWAYLGKVEITPLGEGKDTDRDVNEGDPEQDYMTCGNWSDQWLPKSPPYPHPMSANSTLGVSVSEGFPVKKSGYSSDQSISSGHTGLRRKGEVFNWTTLQEETWKLTVCSVDYRVTWTVSLLILLLFRSPRLYRAEGKKNLKYLNSWATKHKVFTWHQSLVNNFVNFYVSKCRVGTSWR